MRGGRERRLEEDSERDRVDPAHESILLIRAASPLRPCSILRARACMGAGSRYEGFRCVCACVRACVRVCVRARACVCVRVGTGSRYEGEFLEDQRHGRGVYDYLNGDR